MENKYKIIISKSNYYKEIPFPADMESFTLGTLKNCDVRVLKSVLYEDSDFEIGFVYKNDIWQLQCSDNIYITTEGTEKLYIKNLQHGDFLAVRYDESGNLVFNLEFLIDFESNSKSYSRRIDISSRESFSIGSDKTSDICLGSEYVNGDRILVERDNNTLILTAESTRYGVYHNGVKARMTETVRSGDFFSISDFFFYYKDDCLWTEIREDLKVHSMPVLDDPLSFSAYPQFNRSTRIKNVLNEEMIEIFDPPEKPQKPKNNILTRLLPSLGMLLASGVMALFGGGMIIFSAISGVMAIITAILGMRESNKEFKQSSADRIEKYNAYIEKKRDEIRTCREEEKNILEKIYISQDEELSRFHSFSPKLFDRTKTDEDFLCVCLGKGDLEAKREVNFKKQERLEVADDLQQLPEQLYNEFRFVHDAPIICDLKSVNAIGIVGPEENRFTLLKDIVTDLVARQYHTDVSMVFVASEEHSDRVLWLRMLPHVYNKVTGTRNIVCNDESKNLVFEYLYKELSHREQSKGFDGSHIVVFFYDDYGFNRHPISRFLDKAKDLGVSFVFFAEDQFGLPLSCGYIIKADETNRAVLIDTQDNKKDIPFVYPLLPDVKAEELVSLLAPVHTEEISLEGELTKNLTMFELLNIMTVDDLDLEARWAASQVTRSMAAPIGVTKSNVVYLDLHERAHGPHGLVAGTTGSGKSELLQTYVLSMATLYHPYEVSFLIIDFKGGGMANQFKNLPHLLGAITNIDGREIDRSLKSIEAEIRRRQRLFAEASSSGSENQVNHIDQYIQKYKTGQVSTPLPHLIIIVDEFAELKAQQPDFMNSLISAARVGRSLGIHLILATQKPSGQVNDQIWSNSRFKLCLKVQDQGDSNEVIKSPLAAEIKEPGRAYLQVGNNEIFELFQSAYSGAAADSFDTEAAKKYEISELTVKQKKHVVFRAKASGRSKNVRTQLQAVIDHIENYCNETNIPCLPAIFQPALPELIPFSQDTEETDIVNVTIGIYDDPDNQFQGKADICLSEDNLLIVGASQTGKTNLIQTIIRQLASLYSPERVAIYIADFGTMSLKNFEEMNHVGGVVTISEEERFRNLFKLLMGEIESRKQKLSASGLSSYHAYLESGRRDIPLIAFIIDNFSAFKEVFADQYESTLIYLLREGQTYGISVIISNSQTNGFNFKYMASIGRRIVFSCNDRSEYSNLLDRCRIEPKNTPGRGLFSKNKTIYEFQTYLSFEGEKEIDRIQRIHDFIEEINGRYDYCHAKLIPSVPDTLSIRYIQENYSIVDPSENIYSAVDYNTIECVGFNCYEQTILAIAGNRIQQRKQFVYTLMNDISINILKRPVKLYIIDNYKKELSSYKEMPYTEVYTTSAERLTQIAEEVHTTLEERYEQLDERGEEELHSMPWLIVVINNKLALEVKQCDNLIEDIGKKYANLKILFLITDILDKNVSSGSKLLRMIKEDKKLLYFGPINEIKLIDTYGSLKTMGALVSKDDAYYINGDKAYRVKTIQEV